MGTTEDAAPAMRFLGFANFYRRFCNGPRSMLQLAGDDSTSLSRMEREEEKE
ncbi:hypothetical protein N657DRAFT_11020 [Parathielavia appendiculata]|uniref:Uncharacterized protein n=1 Tax=Parathielavia appendiculata TaxID=2587402 RepID=A0AAN6U878_9PEZI|nr:hypothetical protein N657DRAFT_11020 [Parathielavia appendiculata]